MSAVDLYTDATAEWGEWGALQSLSGSGRALGDAERAKARDTLARAVSQAELWRTSLPTPCRIAAAGVLNADESGGRSIRAATAIPHRPCATRSEFRIDGSDGRA